MSFVYTLTLLQLVIEMAFGRSTFTYDIPAPPPPPEFRPNQNDIRWCKSKRNFQLAEVSREGVFCEKKSVQSVKRCEGYLPIPLKRGRESYCLGPVLGRPRTFIRARQDSETGLPVASYFGIALNEVKTVLSQLPARYVPIQNERMPTNIQRSIAGSRSGSCNSLFLVKPPVANPVNRGQRPVGVRKF